jgi:hypothetical protein
MTAAFATPVVDADGHVLEPPDGMLRYAPAKFRERIGADLWRQCARTLPLTN